MSSDTMRKYINILNESVNTQAKGAAAGFDPSMHDQIRNATPEELSDLAYKFGGDAMHAAGELKLLRQAQAELRSNDLRKTFKMEPLDEGMITNALQKVANWVMSKFPKQELQQLADAVKQAAGDDTTPSMENGVKIMQALGFTEEKVQDILDNAKAGKKLNEDLDTAMVYQEHTKVGKIIMRIIWAIGAGAAINVFTRFGGNAFAINMIGVVGYLILMLTPTFWEKGELVKANQARPDTLAKYGLRRADRKG